MLHAKNIEADGLLRDLWNHIAFLTRQTWQLRGDVRRRKKANPNSTDDWDSSKVRAYRLEIQWLRDMAVENEVTV